MRRQCLEVGGLCSWVISQVSRNRGHFPNIIKATERNYSCHLKGEAFNPFSLKQVLTKDVCFTHFCWDPQQWKLVRHKAQRPADQEPAVWHSMSSHPLWQRHPTWAPLVLPLLHFQSSSLPWENTTWSKMWAPAIWMKLLASLCHCGYLGTLFVSTCLFIVLSNNYIFREKKIVKKIVLACLYL